jgi:rhodanese-related sulfurtransferase
MSSAPQPSRRQLIRLLFGLLLVTPGIACAQSVQSMAVGEAREAARSEDLVLVDIRTPREWRESGVPDVAVPLDMTAKGFVPALLELRRANPSRRLGLICATGARSRYVANWLVQNGVQGVVDVPAGMHTREGWLAKKLPVRPADAVRQPVRAP